MPTLPIDSPRVGYAHLKVSWVSITAFSKTDTLLHQILLKHPLRAIPLKWGIGKFWQAPGSNLSTY